MPIEIKELQIRASVGTNTRESSSSEYDKSDISRIKDELVKEVTEEVIRLIQLKIER